MLISPEPNFICQQNWNTISHQTRRCFMNLKKSKGRQVLPQAGKVHGSPAKKRTRDLNLANSILQVVFTTAAITSSAISTQISTQYVQFVQRCSACSSSPIFFENLGFPPFLIPIQRYHNRQRIFCHQIISQTVQHIPDTAYLCHFSASTPSWLSINALGFW